MNLNELLVTDANMYVVSDMDAHLRERKRSCARYNFVGTACLIIDLFVVVALLASRQQFDLMAGGALLGLIAALFIIGTTLKFRSSPIFDIEVNGETVQRLKLDGGNISYTGAQLNNIRQLISAQNGRLLHHQLMLLTK